MKRLRLYLNLSWSERALLVRAALFLLVIRLGLGLFPFGHLQRLLDRLGPSAAARRKVNRSCPERISWAVAVASRHVPGEMTCLTQALTAKVLLERDGFPALLHFGVSQTAPMHLQAHAWLESQGRVVIGGGGLSRYTPLVDFEGERS